jgi:hypothetical protein
MTAHYNETSPDDETEGNNDEAGISQQGVANRFLLLLSK